MKLTGAQMVCESLNREGVDVLYGLPGRAILPLYQTMDPYPQNRHILVRHEQGPAMAADAVRDHGQEISVSQVFAEEAVLAVG